MQSDQLHDGVVPAHLPPGRRRIATAEDVGLESSSLEVRTRELSNGAYVVAPEGTLDVCTTARLEHALSRVVEARASLVVVDLSETRLADSAPLGLLVLVQRQLSRQGGGLVLACADRTALDLLEATGLNAVFLIEPVSGSSRILDAALASVGATLMHRPYRQAPTRQTTERGLAFDGDILHAVSDSAVRLDDSG